LIPDQYDASSIFELIDFILDLKLEEFQKIANTLPSLLDGVILQDKTLLGSEVAVDPSWEITVAALSEILPGEIDLTDNSQDRLVIKAATDLMNSYPDISALQNLDRWLTSSPEKYKNAMLLASKLAVITLTEKTLPGEKLTKWTGCSKTLLLLLTWSLSMTVVHAKVGR
jgi:hypothetical protein